MPEFRSWDGESIYYRVWDTERPKAVIQVLTGLAEVEDYYEDFARAAADHGFCVYLHEYRQFGRTTAPYGEGNLFMGYAKDGAALLSLIRAERPGLKVFCLCHSLGTMISQLALNQTAARWDGIIFTGLSHNKAAREQRLGQLEMARLAIEKDGPDAASPDIYEAVFNHLNDPFAGEKDPYSFITSDPEKRAWIASLPYTSPVYSNRFFRDFAEAWLMLEDQGLEKTCLTTLPVLILNGSQDVTAENGTYGDTKLDLLDAAGFEDVESVVYEGFRHSILQETLADVVTGDILEWVEEHL